MNAPKQSGRRWHDLRRAPDHVLHLRLESRLCAPCLAADADRSDAPARAGDRARDHARAGRAALEAAPARAGRREGRDFFGNRLAWIELAEPHDRMTIRVAARIVVDGLGEPSPQETPAWEAVRDDGFDTSDIGATSPVHFLFASPQAPLDPAI